MALRFRFIQASRARCLAEEPGNRICREFVTFIERRRLVRDEEGKPVEERIAECPVHGLLLEKRYVEPTTKRYVARRVRVLTAAQRLRATKLARKRMKRYRARLRAEGRGA